MKTEQKIVEQPGQTFLKSTSHVRVLEYKGNYLRSVAVGLQFGVIHFPGEIIEVVIWPLVVNISGSIYSALSNLIFVTRAAIEAIYIGFTGHLDAINEPVDLVYEEDE
ncbi:hypothetical protein [Methylobacter psychrophilus]|uniref:hypothetical protein n=1 Tax=Methylobacter psychrophilus TaxID=96941 RepID=UPI0021D49DF0|nr:hypothetical protein [Methylobacter psychrophilus]